MTWRACRPGRRLRLAASGQLGRVHLVSSGPGPSRTQRRPSRRTAQPSQHVPPGQITRPRGVPHSNPSRFHDQDTKTTPASLRPLSARPNPQNVRIARTYRPCVPKAILDRHQRQMLAVGVVGVTGRYHHHDAACRPRRGLPHRGPARRRLRRRDVLLHRVRGAARPVGREGRRGARADRPRGPGRDRAAVPAQHRARRGTPGHAPPVPGRPTSAKRPRWRRTGPRIRTPARPSWPRSARPSAAWTRTRCRTST